MENLYILFLNFTLTGVTAGVTAFINDTDREYPDKSLPLISNLDENNINP